MQLIRYAPLWLNFYGGRCRAAAVSRQANDYNFRSEENNKDFKRVSFTLSLIYTTK